MSFSLPSEQGYGLSLLPSKAKAFLLVATTMGELNPQWKRNSCKSLRAAIRDESDRIQMILTINYPELMDTKKII
jgi:hypothetical protein